MSDKTSPSVGFVSTYPPTVCGLANFTASLREAIGTSRGTRRGLLVLRMVDDEAWDAQVRDGVWLHRRDDPWSLRRSIAMLNMRDVVSIQHEFGIFGGPDGAEVADLVDGLRVPVVTTFHTVLDEPTRRQRSIMAHLATRSQRCVVMSATGAQRLTRHYGVHPDRIDIIPHGTHERFARPPLAHGRRPLMLTWGLIGPGKGLETAIEACRGLVDLDPLPRYLIAGATHPNVVRHQGEAYRDGLLALVHGLGLDNIVEFDNRYLEGDELGRVVRGADLVVLPYASVTQVTSGVLVEAISAAKPVIATTFPHSVEVLGGGAGMLVPHGDVVALQAAMRQAVTDHAAAARMARIAGRIARGWSWTTIGPRYDRLFTSVVADHLPARPDPSPLAMNRAAG